MHFDTIELPESINSDVRKIWEKSLYLMPSNHPQRLALRDKIAHSVLLEFRQTDESKTDQRLALFKEALFLHDAGDFKPGRVTAEASEMALWVANVFERRGNEALVLAGFRYLMLAEPEKAEYRERYLALEEWSKSVRETVEDRLQQIASLIELFDNMVMLVPDREVVERLAAMHLEHYNLVKDAFQHGMQEGMPFGDPRQILIHGRAIQNMPIQILHIFFLAGDLPGARKYLEGLVKDGSLDVGYLELIDRITQNEDLADSYFSLARSFVPLDPRAALKAYILARANDPKDHRFPMSIGLLFDELECSECAVDFYIESADISPSEEVFAKVLELTAQSLARIHSQELIEASSRVIERADKLVDKALAKHPDKNTELRTFASALLLITGEVDFDDGRLDSARAHFKRSHEVSPNVPALMKLQDVYYLTNDFKSAMKILEQAKSIPLDDTQMAGYLKAVIQEKTADLMAALKRDGEATALYRQALEGLESGSELLDSSPTVAVMSGIIKHQLGDFPGSQAAFRLAIRLDPDRAETYGTLISFLVVNGRLADAVEIYRLAYNQDRIKAMWKIYYSLWVEGLAVRTGKGSIELAKGYLESSNGETWQDSLAKYFCGKITLEDLRKQARNSGQLVEVDYYGAIIAMADGKMTQAHEMLDKVIASNLLGFFEYRMAREILSAEFPVK